MKVPSEDDPNSTECQPKTNSGSVPTTLPLLRGETLLENALEREENLLIKLDYPEQTLDFSVLVYSNYRQGIQSLVSRHLDLSNPADCRLAEASEWLHGSFNVYTPL